MARKFKFYCWKKSGLFRKLTEIDACDSEEANNIYRKQFSIKESEVVMVAPLGRIDQYLKQVVEI